MITTKRLGQAKPKVVRVAMLLETLVTVAASGAICTATFLLGEHPPTPTPYP